MIRQVFVALMVLLHLGAICQGRMNAGCGVDRKHCALLHFKRLNTFVLPELAQYRPARLEAGGIERAECLLRDSVFGTNWKWSKDYDTIPPTPEELEYRSLDRGESYWHFRQYCGMSNARGDLLVFVNAFCSREPKDPWRRHWVFAFDGADCYWQAVINLTTGRVESYEENDDA